jgi:hypothetical protein
MEPTSTAFDGYKDLIGSPARAQLLYDLTSIFHFIHQSNVRRGWWHNIHTGEPKQRNVGEILMLVVSELAEAMEGDRKGLMDDKLLHHPMFRVEIGDALIRLCDIAGSNSGAFIGSREWAELSALALVEKLEFNASREDHSLAARLAGGKKY